MTSLRETCCESQDRVALGLRQRHGFALAFPFALRSRHFLAPFLLIQGLQAKGVSPRYTRTCWQGSSSFMCVPVVPQTLYFTDFSPKVTFPFPCERPLEIIPTSSEYLSLACASSKTPSLINLSIIFDTCGLSILRAFSASS